jgi:membrane protein involved in colicin uptake
MDDTQKVDTKQVDEQDKVTTQDASQDQDEAKNESQDKSDEDFSKKSGGELRRKLEEAIKKNREYEEAERKRKEEEAKKKGDYEALLQSQKEENERLKKEAREYKTSNLLSKKLREAKVKSELEDMVTSHAKNQLEFDESGDPTNLDLVIEELLTKYPPAFGGQTKTSGANVPTNSGTSTSGKIPFEQWKKMGPKERKVAREQGRAPYNL